MSHDTASNVTLLIISCVLDVALVHGPGLASCVIPEVKLIACFLQATVVFACHWCVHLLLKTHGFDGVAGCLALLPVNHLFRH